MRTGTDNLPILSQLQQVGAAATPPQHYSGLCTPSVWRTARPQSAAAKVEALSSKGMHEIEIPAFLCKQDGWPGCEPAGSRGAFGPPGGQALRVS